LESQREQQQSRVEKPAASRVGPWLKRIGALLLSGLLFFVFGFIPWFLVDRIVVRGFTLPDKENTEYVQNSFKFEREDITLTTSDRIKVSGWWIPAPNPRGTVILVHGLNRTRIEMAKKVEPLHGWGFNCILIDLRHHGQSGSHPTTFGLTEQLDVRAAVDYALSRSPGPVVLWGVSLGGASVTMEAADDPRVKGLITDSSYDTLPNTARHHVRLFRSFTWYFTLVPQWPTSDLVLFWTRQLGGFDPAQVDVLAAAAKMKGRPSLFVANRGDRRIPFEIADQMAKLAGDKSRMILTESKSHGGAWRDARAIYEPAVKKLLDEVAPPPGEAAASKVETKATNAAKPVSDAKPVPERTSK
jgi:pimeloyl-ACP methyl ester carboxylesterase